MQSAELRRRHASAVFYTLFVEPGLTQRELSQTTGCDKSTVSLVVRQLESAGLIERIPENQMRVRGRPREKLRVPENRCCLIGVQLELSMLRFVIATLRGRKIVRFDEQFEGGPDEIAASIKAGIKKLCSRSERSEKDVLSIGVSLPGQVNSNGELIYSPALQWKNVPLGEQLKNEGYTSVFVDNDANDSAFAERFYGKAQHVDDFILLETGQGVGGGLFLGGEIYRGRHGLAGEIGHIKVVDDGHECHCGAKGCLAAYLSESAMVKRAHSLGICVSSLIELDRLAVDGDDSAKQVFNESGDYLGAAASDLVNIFNPQILILGGSVSRYWQHVSDNFNESLKTKCLPTSMLQTDILISDLYESSKASGGIATALQGLTESSSKLF